MAQAAFMQLLVDVLHRRVVVGQHRHRLPAQQDIGKDVEDGLSLASPWRPLDHANLRTERLLHCHQLTLVQPERIDQPLARRQRAVAPHAIRLQGGVGSGRQPCQLAHDIGGDVAVSLRLRTLLTSIGHSREILKDWRLFHRSRHRKGDAVHLEDVGFAAAWIMHDSIPLGVDRRLGDRRDDRAAGLCQQTLAQFAGWGNTAVAEWARIAFLGGKIARQLQRFVLIAPVDSPVADLRGSVFVPNLDRYHRSLVSAVTTSSSPSRRISSSFIFSIRK